MKDAAAIPVWFTTLFATTLILAILWVGSGFFIPLAITGLLFVLTSALVDKWKQVPVFGNKIPSWVASLLSVGTVVGVVAAFSLVLSSSADSIQAAIPEYQVRIATIFGQIEEFIGPQRFEMLRGFVAKVDYGDWAAAAASDVGASLSMVALIVLYLVFLIGERSAWIEKLPRLAGSQEEEQQLRGVFARISDGVKQYMWVNAVTSAMSGLVAFVIFSWIELDFAPLLALIVFVVGFIPNIGAFIGIALPASVALIQFDDITPFLIVLFGYGLSDQFIANVIQPSMQGKSLNLSTFMVMVALTFWATLWGGIGAFLAVPMMVVAMVVCAEIPALRWFAILLSGDGKLED